MGERQTQRKLPAVALANEVGVPNPQMDQQCGGVLGHPFIRKLAPWNVERVPMRHLLNGDHSVCPRERRNLFRKRSSDRTEPAVEQNYRPPLSVCQRRLKIPLFAG
jgi:hypothetical protein